jgi:hypothetical protein
MGTRLVHWQDWSFVFFTHDCFVGGRFIAYDSDVAGRFDA